MTKLIYELDHKEMGSSRYVVDKLGYLIVRFCDQEGECYESLTPDQAVDLATKIINHCYPYTRPKKILDYVSDNVFDGVRVIPSIDKDKYPKVDDE